MTTRLRRVTIVVFALFLSLFVSSSLIQTVFADSLNADSRNTRVIRDGYKIQRGSILAGNTVIAQSEASDSVFKYVRTYPGGEAYSSITGYYSHVLASTGIEASENVDLTGVGKSQTVEQLINRINGTTQRGSDVTLSIDPDIQQAAWDALGDRNGAAVAIEPSTGRILALVSKPSYDAAALADNDSDTANQVFDTLSADSSQPLVNRAIAGDTYAPGSTFKLVMTAAALENGYTPDSDFDNPAALTLEQSTTQIHNVTNRACGSGTSKVTLKVALQYSCNIPFAELGLELGSDKVKSTAEAFGFDQDLSIPLAVTASRYPTPTSPAELQLSSFGQANVRVTPLQMASVAATIANGGTRLQPSLIDQVRNQSLEVTSQFEKTELGQAISPETAQTLTDLMVNNVSTEISGARIDGVDVAGKTGTAETTKDGQYNLWFTGFAPANDPKVAVAVVVEDGGSYNNSEGSNKVAAPIAQKIMKAVLDK
ncbi:peptidoglycan D,D-transpeptidase FtsI family protein [Pseudoclavibacter soli]|uniref:peptidoglycan D,D-transpeptidase FtsI family protein n=1 Tax=Pseudoclavibacter soli TaxID=452623 RepID=UPI0004063E80|nr:penicillin-binding protein 2 [Pseudoclavibacter soli]